MGDSGDSGQRCSLACASLGATASGLRCVYWSRRKRDSGGLCQASRETVLPSGLQCGRDSGASALPHKPSLLGHRERRGISSCVQQDPVPWSCWLETLTLLRGGFRTVGGRVPAPPPDRSRNLTLRWTRSKLEMPRSRERSEAWGWEGRRGHSQGEGDRKAALGVAHLRGKTDTVRGRSRVWAGPKRFHGQTGCRGTSQP